MHISGDLSRVRRDMLGDPAGNGLQYGSAAVRLLIQAFPVGEVAHTYELHHAVFSGCPFQPAVHFADLRISPADCHGFSDKDAQEEV